MLCSAPPTFGFERAKNKTTSRTRHSSFYLFHVFKLLPTSSEMEVHNLVCKTPSHSMTLRLRMSQNIENDEVTTKAKTVGTAGIGSRESLMGERSALGAVSLNIGTVGLTGLGPSLQSKADRQLRPVKKAWGTFKAKMKPSGRRNTGKGAKRHLLELAFASTPRTPEGVLRLLNTPLPLSTDGTPRNSRRYRDPMVLSPFTPVSGARRSERIAAKTPTSMKIDRRGSVHRQMPRRLHSAAELTNEINRVTLQLDALTQGMMVFESVGADITKHMAKQDGSATTAENSKKGQ